RDYHVTGVQTCALPISISMSQTPIMMKKIGCRRSTKSSLTRSLTVLNEFQNSGRWGSLRQRTQALSFRTIHFTLHISKRLLDFLDRKSTRLNSSHVKLS